MTHRKSYKLSAAKGGDHPKQTSPKASKKVGVHTSPGRFVKSPAVLMHTHTSPHPVTSPAGHSKLHKRRT